MKMSEKMAKLRSTVHRHEDAGVSLGSGSTTFQPKFDDKLDAWVYHRIGAEGAEQDYACLCVFEAESQRWIVFNLEDNPDFEMGQGVDPWIEAGSPAKGEILAICNSGLRYEALVDPNGKDRYYADRLDGFGYGIQAHPKRPGVDTSAGAMAALNNRFASRAENRVRQQTRNQSRYTRGFPSAGGRGPGQVG